MKEQFTGIIDGERWSVLECGNYAISDHGRVMKTASGKTCIGGKLLRPFMHGECLGIRTGPKANRKGHYIHRLVFAHFIAPIPEEGVVRHDDGDIQNNHYSNLSMRVIQPDLNRRRERAEREQRLSAEQMRYPESVVLAAKLANRHNSNPICHHEGVIDGERWVVLGCQHYAVSSFGRVMRTVSGTGTYPGKLLKARITTTGYVQFVLLNRIHMLSHRLVAEAFIGPAPEGMHVNHLDGVKCNNHVSNLEYVTPMENIQHAMECGLSRRKKRFSSCVGVNHWAEEWF